VTEGDWVTVTSALRIPVSELSWRFTRSGGPGGQHANTSDTRVEVAFDVAGSSSLTEAQRRRLLDRIGPEARAASAEERSKLRNRQIALDRLAQRLREALHVEAPRRPTRPTRASQRRRVESKRHRSEIKRLRRPPED